MFLVAWSNGRDDGSRDTDKTRSGRASRRQTPGSLTIASRVWFVSSAGLAGTMREVARRSRWTFRDLVEQSGLARLAHRFEPAS